MLAPAMASIGRSRIEPPPTSRPFCGASPRRRNAAAPPRPQRLTGDTTMTRYRSHLPQLDGGLFLTDGGIETTLIFHDGLELPYFAAFHLLREARGRAALRAYYARYIEIARREGVGFILESPTWRA